MNRTEPATRPPLFLDGEVRADDVVFDGFTVTAGRFAVAVPPRGRVTFSLRPQSIHLHRQRPATGDAAVVAGEVAQRAYLGEHWDYAVRPAGSALTLRVTARPHEVFDVNEKVWLEIDARQMAPIAEA
jgi:ABC-type Fe3+/spermidine/putrescine transport system ATPase subunit